MFKPEAGGDSSPEATPPQSEAVPVKAFALSPDALLVTMLVEQARRFREAVGARKQLLSAVERYYLDVVSCQWRLDAIETMLRAASGERSNDPEQQALLCCLREIDAQRDAAAGALEERFDTYSLGIVAPGTGLVERLTLGEAERKQGSQRLHQFVVDVYDEIGRESQELVQVAKAGGDTRQLLPTIRRRQQFWQDQFEETWSAWTGATARMHNAGEDAVRAWLWLATAAKWTERVPTPSSAKGLADAISQLLEVELLDSLGLVGLDTAVHGWQTGLPMLDRSEESSDGWQSMRFALLQSMLQRLAEAGVPHDAELSIPSKLSELGRLKGVMLSEAGN